MTSYSFNKLDIAIIGFGAQAQAWSQNLLDNGHQVTIYLRKDSISLQKVKALGLNVKTLTQLQPEHDCFVLLTPDHTHFSILEQYFRALKQVSIILAHGYSHWKHNFQEVFPDLNFMLLAPKAIASELRANFLETKPIFAACSQSENPLMTALSQGIGITNCINSDFQEEAIADLFSEQSLLCGLIPYAARMSYQELVDNGTNPEIAYIECWHEVKLIADAMINFGPKGLFELISPNALMGAELFKKQYLNQDWKQNLQQCLSSIKNREFIEYESQNDMDMLRTTVLEDWANSEIQKTYTALKEK